MSDFERIVEAIRCPNCFDGEGWLPNLANDPDWDYTCGVCGGTGLNPLLRASTPLNRYLDVFLHIDLDQLAEDNERVLEAKARHPSHIHPNQTTLEVQIEEATNG